MPSVSSFAITAGSASTAFSSRLSFSITGRGVFAGARIATHELTSKSGTPDSMNVGTSGSDDERHVPPEGIREGLAAALVRNVDDVGAGAHLEQLAPDVRRAAYAGAA